MAPPIHSPEGDFCICTFSQQSSKPYSRAIIYGHLTWFRAWCIVNARVIWTANRSMASAIWARLELNITIRLEPHRRPVRVYMDSTSVLQSSYMMMPDV